MPLDKLCKIRYARKKSHSFPAEAPVRKGLEMPRFFCEALDPDAPVLTGPDANHIGRALRMRPGQQIVVCAQGTDHLCEIVSITPDTVYLKTLQKTPCASEPTVSVTLYQAMPKLDKLEQIIQKSVELGAVRIAPVLTRRCVSRPAKSDFFKKLQRLQSIALAAAKQSGRGIIPQVSPLLSFSEALEEIRQTGTSLFFYEEGGTRLSQLELPQAGEIAMLIGSEGGFDPEEAQAAKDAGMTAVWLGPRILRCETAPLTALSVVMHETGNL